LATLVYAVVNSLQHCSCWFTKDSHGQTIQRVLNAAARVVTGTRKFDSGLGHDTARRASLAWRPRSSVLQAGSDSSPTSERPRHCTCRTIGLYVPAASADTRRQLRSSNRQLLAVPRYRLNTYGCRSLSVAGPTVWNSLPDFILDPTISADVCLRRICLLDTSALSVLEGSFTISLLRYINLLTYLQCSATGKITVGLASYEGVSSMLSRLSLEYFF